MQGWPVTFSSNVVLVLLISLIAVSSAIWFYRRLGGSVHPRRLGILLGLRLLGLCLLLILIFRPAIGFRASPTRESILTILVDSSKSMKHAGANSMEPLEYAKQLLGENRDLLVQDPGAQVFSFSDQVSSLDVDRIRDLQSTGQSTDIALALRSIPSHVPSEKLQAVILLTDGNHLGKDSPVDGVKMVNRPVYCLGVGSAETGSGMRNVTISVADPPVKMAARASNPVLTEVRWQGMGDQESFRLTTTIDDKEAGTKSLPTASESGKRQVEVEVKPQVTGKVVCRLRASPPSADVLPADDVREFHALALPDKFRVLMVEGQVRPEYKYLKQYLQSDSAVALAAFVQVRPGKFLVTSRIANYQPKDLPSTKSEFEQFDLVILGDVSSRTFSRQQQQWLKELVESGRGLLFVPGQETSELRGTVLSELLGVRLASTTTWSDRAFGVRVAPAGQVHPALKNMVPLFGKETRFHGLLGLGELLPGSAVLLDDGGSGPVLITRSIGKGRSAILASASTWQWRLNANPRLREQVYPMFWGQLIRYLGNKDSAGEQKPTLLVNIARNAVATSETVRVRTDLFDGAGKPDVKAPVSVSLVQNGKKVQGIPLSPQADHQAGHVEIRQPGQYELQAEAHLGNQRLTDAISITVYQIDKELQQVGLNQAMLDEMAAAGGTERMLPASEFGRILRDLRERYAVRAQKEAEVNEFRTFDHRVYLLAMFLIAFSAEWFLRYRWGLR